MEKILETLQEVEKSVQTLDHMIYVTFPLIKDKKLLLKILLETKVALTKCINIILQYEYLYKRIRLHKDIKTNLRTFQEKCAPRYYINPQEIKRMQELFSLAEQHKQSPFEFVRNEKVVIMSENFKLKTITLEETKEFVILAKTIITKIKRTINPNL